MHQVIVKETDQRKEGVAACLRCLGDSSVKGKHVLIKPNFNTADPAPGSTHNETLAALVEGIWEMGATRVSLGERSYLPTHQVMAAKNVVPLLESRDVRIVDFDKLEARDWIEFKPKDSHWEHGFRVARPIVEAECLVSTGCLKTHQFGGVFTLSLKLHVGTLPTARNGYPLMAELHQSPYQQEMIAEINQPFAPHIVLLDGVDVFVDGGPATGRRAKGNVFLAAADRVAVDAAGVAVLKLLGSNRDIMNRPIYEQKQIRRAAELRIGAASPGEIEMVAVDLESQAYADRIGGILANG